MKKKRNGRVSPNTAELASIYSEIFKKPNVRCCYIGKKAKKNLKTEEVAIICGVTSKIGKKDLSPSDVIPPHFPWLKNSSRPWKIKTDVVEFAGKFELQQGTILGPGDLVTRLQTSSSATVGIALNHPDLGPVITTAGHLFENPRPNEEVEISSGGARVSGLLKKCVRDSRADYALISIEDPYSAGNLFRDMYPLGPLHFSSDQDLHKKVSILTATKILEVTCEGIHGHLNDGEINLTGLIFTTCKTLGGDSGSCLIGENNEIWGLLVGSTKEGNGAVSAFLPAYIPLDRENADLI